MTALVRVLLGALLAALGVTMLDAAALVPTASAPSATAHVAEPMPPPVPAAPTQEYCNIHYGKPIGAVFTWQGFTFQKYIGDAACETHRQGIYGYENVATDADGDLVISARREGSSYSVGRVRLTDFRVPETDFEWGFEARLPEQSAPGSRSALWLVNLEQIYCDPLWGELDVLEWYSSRPDLPEAATHATCADATYASWHHKPATWDWGPGGPTGFHRWAVRKETTERGITISYLYDDRVYATDTCQERLSGPTCAAVLDKSWTAILQTAVFADESGSFTRPDPGADFPDQELVVRAMWVTPL